MLWVGGTLIEAPSVSPIALRQKVCPRALPAVPLAQHLDQTSLLGSVRRSCLLIYFLRQNEVCMCS